MRAVTLFLMALLIACGGGGSDEAKDPPPPPLHAAEPPLLTNATVVFMGDSITNLWPLQNFVPGSINVGVNGNTTAQMLERFDADVLARQPSIVVILGGTNDIAAGNSDPVHLYAMVQKAMAAKAVVVVGTLPPPASPTPELTQQMYTQYNQAVRDGAGAYGYQVANFHSAMVLSNGKINQSLFLDGVHPNADGYNEMWWVLRPILASLRPVAGD